VGAVSEIAGGWFVMGPMLTPENVAVAANLGLRLVTASPTYTVEAIDTVTLPIMVQVAPSADRKAVNLLHWRSSFSQTGDAPAPPVVSGVNPAKLVLCWKAMPLAGVTRANAYFEAGARDSRIITPAFDHALMFCNVATRAMIVVFPDTF
jgi:hypothetical protein